jgi:peptide/nickel transport system permease protein
VTTYVLRRLLLMIPTLFGITIVSFLIMQLAPGDPLLSHADAQGGAHEASREAYLVQKRALGLDKPALLNFNDFRDFRRPMQAAADILGQPTEALSHELPALVGLGGEAAQADDETTARRAFLQRLKIPDFEVRLADASQRETLARSVVDFVQVWCEDVGTSGVPAAAAILRDPASSLGRRRGAIHALNHLLRDPFAYTYGRRPTDAETAAVTTSWQLWRMRSQQDHDRATAGPSPERRAELAELFPRLVATESRMELMNGLETLHKSDVSFFAEKLLDERSTLAEKNVAALMLRLYVGKPLKTDVAADADEARVAETAENWLAYYDGARDRYEPTTATKLAHIVADTQYARLVTRLATFDFGPSMLGTHEPVGGRIWRAFQATAPLMLAAELVIYLIAVPLGIVSAVHRGRWWDRFISFVLFVLYSVPTFVAAMIALLLFCYGGWVKWFPMSGLHSPSADELTWGAWLFDYARHAFLPVMCLSIFSLAGMAMYARSSMIDVISEDYIRTARAKGVPERTVIWKHALRNALIPVITLFADFLPAMLGGSVLVEVLFSIPGMGRLSWSSIEQKDYPTLMALVYVDAIVVLLSILLSDVLYYFVDPRINLDASDDVAL